jgi:hypothetical protein
MLYIYMPFLLVHYISKTTAREGNYGLCRQQDKKYGKNAITKNESFKLIVTLFLVSLTLSLFLTSVVTSSDNSISYALSNRGGVVGSVGKGSVFVAQNP